MRLRGRAKQVISALVIFGALILSTLVSPEQAADLATQGGIVGLGLLAGGIAVTQIAAPLSGVPFLFAAIKLYGYETAMATFFVVSLTTAAVNFWIARSLGRTAVARLVGRQGLVEVGRLESDSVLLLVAARTFGYYFFDIVSYAAGLTAMPFWKYYAVTVAASLPTFTFFYLLYRHIDFHSTVGVAIYYGSLVALALAFGVVLRHVLSRQGPK